MRFGAATLEKTALYAAGGALSYTFFDKVYVGVADNITALSAILAALGG